MSSILGTPGNQLLFALNVMTKSGGEIIITQFKKKEMTNGQMNN